MGCCLSTQNDTTAKAKRQTPISPPSNRHHHHHHTVSKSPPRAEEEAVKEVLSETPKLVLLPANPETIPIPIPNPNPYYYTPIPKINHGAAASTANGFPTAMLAHRTASPRKHPHSLHLRHHHSGEIAKLTPPPLSPPSPVAAVTPDEISEVSEISCLSESVSTATAGDGEVRQRVHNITPSPGQIYKPSLFSNDPAVRRERNTGKSPVKRSNPSPRRTGPEVVRNRVGGTGIGDGQRRREFGENSGRRSRSPVARNESVVRRSNAGRSPSARKTGISPARVRMVQPGCGPGGDGRKEEENGRDRDHPSDPTVPSESLENPLVSLECFIFL
ncbi:hypothetical protein V2J09_009935 [Rumex salicifolius]